MHEEPMVLCSVCSSQMGAVAYLQLMRVYASLVFPGYPENRIKIDSS